MRSRRAKITTWLVLAALMVPALGSASLDACIAACSGGFPGEDAQCALTAADKCHAAKVSVSSSCCAEKETAPQSSSMTGHSDSGGCTCPMCSMAPSRFFTDRAPVKLPPMAKMIVPATVILAPDTASFVHADEARCARIPTGLTRAQLCVYLC